MQAYNFKINIVKIIIINKNTINNKNITNNESDFKPHSVLWI